MWRHNTGSSKVQRKTYKQNINEWGVSPEKYPVTAAIERFTLDQTLTTFPVPVPQNNRAILQNKALRHRLASIRQMSVCDELMPSAVITLDHGIWLNNSVVGIFKAEKKTQSVNKLNESDFSFFVFFSLFLVAVSGNKRLFFHHVFRMENLQEDKHFTSMSG